MASSRTPTGFMGLPREVRDLVYRNLLTTSAAFDTRTEKFQMHPAILGVNKQTLEEAGKILQNENNFVVLELNGDSENWKNCLSEFQDIPRFKKFLISRSSIQPTLLITLKDRQATSRRPPLPWKVSIITGPEGIQPLVECFWRIALGFEYGVHRRALNSFFVTLTLHSRVGSRLDELQNLLLKPFRNVQGLGSITLNGTDLAFSGYLLRRINQGPIPSEAKQVFEESAATGEREYNNGNYRQAHRHWETLYLFKKWIDIQVNSMVFHADMSMSEILDGSPQELFRPELGDTRALLRLGEYEKAALAAQDCLEELSEIYPDNDVLRGKLELCTAVASFGFMGAEWPTKAFWESLKVIMEARQGARSTRSLVRVLQDFFSAKESWPAGGWFKHFLRSRALWEMLDNKEEEEWEGYQE
ncbi:hypothetical protein MMC30_004551 [Trapelia coarctata]|nr:hypothetical protein [Trapelia coarctata]